MSIYISVACLYKDKELLNTIRTAKDNSSDPDSIHIGIVFIGDPDFKNTIDNAIKNLEYKNIKTKFVEFEDAVGVYAGRKLASEMYENQDYFLQIDAHTFFLQNWDLDLIYRYKKALKVTKNKKTILTGVPGAYGYSDFMPKHVEKNTENRLIKKIKNIWYWQDTGYSFFIKDEWWLSSQKCIPRFSDTSVLKTNKKLLKNVRRTGFAPAVKVCAAFMFGNKYFAEDTRIDPITFFWEEEILQTINLIGDGFTLVHIGFLGPILHHFKESAIASSDRTTLITDIFNQDVTFSIMEKNYLDYYNNPDNFKKIKYYESYAGISLINGRLGEKMSPSKYANKKRLFLR
jgi:hypothetical protein